MQVSSCISVLSWCLGVSGGDGTGACWVIVGSVRRVYAGVGYSIYDTCIVLTPQLPVA